MIFPYILFCAFCILLSIKIYKKKFNPISMYFAVWVIMVFLYEIKLVNYYDLTVFTWLIIYSFHLTYFFGCMIGKEFSTKKLRFFRTKYVDEKKYKNILRNTIITMTCIAGISKVISIYNLFKIYGFDFINSAQRIYGMRVMGESGFESIPYLGSFLNLAIIFAGIYFVKYGFGLFMIFPLMLTVLTPFISGTRDEIVTYAILLIVAILITKKTRIFNWRLKFKLVIITALLISSFVFVNQQRSVWVSPNEYMSPKMQQIVMISPSYYKLYTYFSSPVGVLNEYLKNPEYSFGKNSLIPAYSILNKIGFEIEINRYQTSYNIPINSNVGTYIREVIEDYTIGVGLVLVLLFGIIFSQYFKRASSSNDVEDICIVSILSAITILSFFVLYFRSANYWTILICGLLISRWLDSYKIKLKS